LLLHCIDYPPRSMTNWNGPSVILAESIALVKFVHVISGLYIWEFIWSLDYERSIMTGRRKFCRTSPIYIGCRWFTLLVVTLELLDLNTSHDIDCKVMVTIIFVFSFLMFLLASSLVILRIGVLWEHNKAVLTVVSTAWLANAAIYIYSTITGIDRGHWAASVCALEHTSRAKLYVFSTFITDLVLLALMLAGVLRWCNIHGRSATWQLMYTQGLIWVAVFTLVEVPPVVFLTLNLNDPMNRLFLIPGVISMAICTSRMYLGLVNSMTSTLPAGTDLSTLVFTVPQRGISQSLEGNVVCLGFEQLPVSAIT